jgi:hypothetical protein
MTQPLFFEPEVQFEKVASEVMLPEDPNTWPNELMQELFKQVPYVADFEPHVTMDRVDAERGFAFGHIEVQNKTEVQHGASPDAMQAAGIKSARIPIVIKDRKLQPLDLLVTADSKILPLTEARLRQAIFRPQVFDITGRGPGDMSMIGQLYPPYRQNYGFGGGGATMNVGMGKEGEEKQAGLFDIFQKKDSRTQRAYEEAAAANDAALKAGKSGRDAAAAFDAVLQKHKEKRGSILAAILPTINAQHYEQFFQKLSSDQGLQAQFLANGYSTVGALKLLADYTPDSTRKLAGVVLRSLKPTVAQLRKEAEGYRLKTAAHNCWMPEEKELDRGAAVRLLGDKVVLAADTTGSATMTLGQGVAEEKPSDQPEEDKPEIISQFGIYKVQDEKGRHLIGYVFPNLIDTDGTALPIALFTNGSQMAVQGEIAGINVGGGASLFEGHPRGKGAFYHLLPNGRAQATIPMTIKATLDSPEQGGVTLVADTFDGREVHVLVQPNIQSIMPSPEGDHLLIPDSFSWLPLEQAEETALVGDPAAFDKEVEAKQALASVEVRYGGYDSFSVRGFAVEKLAADERNFLSLDDTMFLLGALGADLDYVQTKLGEAGAWSRPVSIRVGRYIKTAEARLDESVRSAVTTLEGMPDLRRDLFKEAAVIPDPVAVDTVLSLGFLNPENLGIFISYMPVIDGAQEKMCELLLAARLGLREVPVPALEKAVRSTEDVLEGLKVLAFQKG